MPGPNNGLIVPAILYLNPGITKEKYAELLGRTRTGEGDATFHSFEGWKEASWDFVGEEDSTFHGGLEGLSKILNLQDPNGVADWNQKKGVFKYGKDFLASMRNGRNGWRWKQEGGRYFLDLAQTPGCFQEWIDSSNPAQSGYSDLVVSAEALKLEAWKVFEFKGYLKDRVHFFIESFPQVQTAYEQALWDGWTSDYAKSKGMTVNEFLRLRLEAKVR